MTHSFSHQRFERARRSLDGLSVGDAFGEQFFDDPDIAVQMLASDGLTDELMALICDDEAVRGAIARRDLPLSPWRTTDDTEMALSIVLNLRLHGEIEPDALARSFSLRYDHARGYGIAMHDILPLLRFEPWQQAAPRLFGGEGSLGNGAAMRVALVGAFFADDLEACAENARRSAVVTHSHPEAVAGAIAVALATAIAVRGDASNPREFLNHVLHHVPDSRVREGLGMAHDMVLDASVEDAVAALDNGTRVTAHNTVPFTLWCAARHLDSYEEGLWECVSGLGDRDTTCAIVGGILGAALEIPKQWLASREPLPTWAFEPPQNKGDKGSRRST